MILVMSKFLEVVFLKMEITIESTLENYWTISGNHWLISQISCFFLADPLIFSGLRRPCWLRVGFGLNQKVADQDELYMRSVDGKKTYKTDNIGFT